MNWTEAMHPVVAPDVETSRSRHGNTPKIELAVWILVGFASSLVTLRIYYHFFRGRRHLWSDDYFLVAALVSSILLPKDWKKKNEKKATLQLKGSY